MFSVAPKVLFYSWNVFTLAPVLKSNPSEPLSHGYWIPPYGFRSCPGTRFLINPRTYKQIRTPIVEQGGRRRGGGGGGWNPSPEFLIRYNISKRFWLKWKDFDLFDKMRYILWVVALRESLWRHQQWPSSWLPRWPLPRIGNQVKIAKNGDFLCFTWKVTYN